jgi:NAD(P)-dependent dehydrogenase (short-subunit alcohol dehydrogenase family)
MSSPVVLITGALTGIGLATALLFANEGARVVVSGRRDSEGEALATELQSLGAEGLFLRCDVRKDEEVRDWWIGPLRILVVWMQQSTRVFRPCEQR